MILILITFVKSLLFLNITKISENQFEFEGDFSFDNIQESEQKFQSFITTSQFQLQNNEYMYSGFPRSTDLITINQISNTCAIPLFLLGNIEQEPIIQPNGQKLTISNIVHFSHAPLNELTIGQSIQIDNLQSPQQFQIAKNNDNVGIFLCLSNQNIEFDLTFESLDYNEKETHSGFLQDNQQIEENCISKARTIFTYDLLKPFTFNLMSKQTNLKILLEHEKDNVVSYYDLKVNQASIERGQFIKISCTNQEIQDSNFIIDAEKEKSSTGNALMITIIVIAVIIGVGIIILIIILLLIYLKKKKLKEQESQKSEIDVTNIFNGLHGNQSSDEENNLGNSQGKSHDSIEDFKNESYQEQLMESQARTEQYQFGSNIDFDTGKLKKASFDISMENEGFLNYQEQKTKKKINLEKSKSEIVSQYQNIQETDEEHLNQSNQSQQNNHQQQSLTIKQSKTLQPEKDNFKSKKSDENERDTLLNQ